MITRNPEPDRSEYEEELLSPTPEAHRLGLDDEPLPLYGMGPALMIGCAGLTALGYLGHYFHWIPDLTLVTGGFLLDILGVLLVIMGLILWVRAVWFQRIQQAISENILLTEGVYAWVRHPVYAGIFWGLTGLLCFTHNLALVPIPLLQAGLIIEFVRRTEEKWLVARYGAVYLDYAIHVPRLFPRFW